MNRFTSSLLIVGLALTGFGTITSAQAQVQSKITASVAQTCSITGVGLAFGTYVPTGVNATQALDAQTTLTVKCSAGTTGVNALVMAGAATNASCDKSDNYRALVLNTTYSLSYKIYSDADRTKEFGCASSNWQTLSTFDNSNVGQSVVLYGRIPANQYVGAGAFKDTVEFRVVF